MAVKRFIRKPSIPSLTGWPDWSHAVMNPVKQTLEIFSGRRGAQLDVLSGPVPVDLIAERVNEIVRLLQDRTDGGLNGADPPAAVAVASSDNLPVSALQQSLGGNAVTSFSALVGDGAQVSFSLTHNLNSYDVVVCVRTTDSPPTRLKDADFDVTFTNLNELVVTFSTAPAVDEYAIFLVAIAG
jgi:hypothetical protein